MADEKQRKPKASKIVTGDVGVSTSKKVKDAFIQKDGKTIRDYAFFDVFIPSVKRTIYDLITRIFGMALFGDKSSNGYSPPGGVDYARPYQQVAYRADGSVYKPYNQTIPSSKPSVPSTGYEYESWVFSNRGDAEAVLNQLTDMIELYGFVTIVDLYDSVGKTAPYTADNFGWRSMAGCETKLCSGGWRLSMTRPSVIEK